MIEVFKEKGEQVFKKVTTDPRWDINDQTLFNVFGLTYYGYCFGIGRLVCFLEPEDINAFVQEKLEELGAGKKYVSGLIEFAYSTFTQSTEGINAQLVGIGHSHFTSINTDDLVNSVFNNAKSIA
ncbi:hypothetical protein [Pedobacter xixiisoli]|uniref:Uncharacterized protein n=1 Tax=Pedobacter xixiisoli TaxID=1476464 RepID=A0A286ADF9_9SPHI|nr:hypothetical protein [Pedobacter xixiisoli]SOD19942.1 hypothetical protein SAMN06297358_3649 [Pedobacter xixiisoli]